MNTTAASRLLHVQDAARLLQFGDAMSGVRLQLADPLAAPTLVRQLAEQPGRWLLHLRLDPRTCQFLSAPSR